MKIKPLSPNEIVFEIPDFVIEAVNNLLKKNYRGTSCKIKAKDIIAEGRRLGKEVLLSTRMHLTQEMVQKLLPTLQKFAETGEL